MKAESQIREVIQTYFDSMYESSAAKARAAFHPAAKITGFRTDGKLTELSVDEFAGYVESKQPSAKSKGEAPKLDVLSIEVAGYTAVARVRDDYLGLTYLDTLSFIRLGDQWQIYNKLFHIEGKAS